MNRGGGELGGQGGEKERREKLKKTASQKVYTCICKT